MSTGAELTNPYAAEVDRSRTGGRAVGVAGRALVAGAIGLGSVVTFAGTGFADEANPADSGPGSAQGVNDDEAESSEAEAGSSEAEAESESSVVTEGDPSDLQMPTKFAHRGSGRVLPLGPDALAEAPELSASGDGQGALPVLDSESSDAESPDSAEPGSAESGSAESGSAESGSAESVEEGDAPAPVAETSDEDPAAVELVATPGGAVLSEALAPYAVPADGESGGVLFVPGTGEGGVTPAAEEADGPGDADRLVVGGGPEPSGSGNQRPILPITIELPEDVRQRILDAQRQVPAGEPGARVDIGAVDSEPERFELAPGVEFVAPTADFGGATYDINLGEGSLGVTGIAANAGQLVLSETSAVPLDPADPSGMRSVAGSETTFTFDPQDLSGYPVGGPAEEPAPPASGVRLTTENRIGLESGTPRPDEAPTGDDEARWNHFVVDLGANGTVDLRNGDRSVGSSGTVGFPVRIAADGGEDTSTRRSEASGSVIYAPQVTSGPDGSDSSTRTQLAFKLGGSVGPRTNDEGVLERPGVRIGGELFGNYNGVNGLQVLDPATDEQVETNQAQYNVGGRAELQALESQPMSGASVTLAAEGGVRGASIETEAGRNATGPNAYLNFDANGDWWIATAEEGKTRGVVGVGANANLTLDEAAGTTYSAEITPRAEVEIPLDETTDLTGGVSYTIGTNDAEGGYGGFGGKVSLATDLGDSRAAVEAGYEQNSSDTPFTVGVRITPGAAETPQPEPVSPAPVVLDPGVAAAFAPADIDFSQVEVPQGPAPAVAEPVAPVATSAGIVSNSADDLLGTSAVGIDLAGSSPGEQTPQASVSPPAETGEIAAAATNEPTDIAAMPTTEPTPVVADLPVDVPAEAPADVPAAAPAVVDTPSEPAPQVEAPIVPEPSPVADVPDLGLLSLDLPSLDVPSIPDLSSLSSPALTTSTYEMSPLKSFDVSSFDTPSFGGFGGFGV